MRIIADKKDYYDCIQAHGQDQSLLYIRKPEEVLYGRWPFASLYSGWWFGMGTYDREIVQHIIGFCGKIYPMLEVYGRQDDPTLYGYIQDVSFSKKCFSIEDVDIFVEEHFTQGEKNSYYGKHSRWRRHGKRHEFVKFFEQCKREQNSYTEMFLEKHCPIFVAVNSRKPKIIYNSLLRPYDFVRIFDPYTAFQEISMFLGGLAVPEKQMPIIPDELKLRSKGFSDQSFRSQFRDSKRIPK